MASNVFGTPITNETLKQMPEYEKDTITQKDRAAVALRTKNSGGKDKDAKDYLDALRKMSDPTMGRYKIGWMACLIYNATGNAVTIDYDCSSDGKLGSPYPLVIANGQWGAFFRSDTWGQAAIVYAGFNDNEDGDGAHCHFLYLYGYDTRQDRFTCYTDICTPECYPKMVGKGAWEEQYREIFCGRAANASRADNLRFSSFASIGGNSNFVTFEGIMTLQGAWLC